MSPHYRRIGLLALAISWTVAVGPVEAQPFYGGGHWGGGYRGYGGYGGGAAQTVQGSELQGAGMYAMGLGRYNVETAQARSVNTDTAMKWNQYVYQSRQEGERIYYNNHKRKLAADDNAYNAIRTRQRNNPSEIDIADGNALNIVLMDLNEPGVFAKATYEGSKRTLGGEMIRDIPFQYASAGISTSVHQLTQGPAPAPLQGEVFATDRVNLKATAAELRKESEDTGSPKPETIRKAKDQIMALKAKVEATFPQTSQERRDAEKYVKSLYGLASMLDTPAVNVLLAGVEKRPEASLGDLLGFMAAYNLRFGASTNPRQREIYLTLYPMIAKLRNDLMSSSGPAAPGSAPMAGDAPGAVFEGLGYNHAEKPAPKPPAPK